MIPEAGTFTEMKAAVLKYCTADPLPGERYEIAEWGWVGENAGIVGSMSNSAVFIQQKHSKTWGHSVPRKRWREMRADGGARFVGYVTGIWHSK